MTEFARPTATLLIPLFHSLEVLAIELDYCRSWTEVSATLTTVTSRLRSLHLSSTWTAAAASQAADQPSPPAAGMQRLFLCIEDDGLTALDSILAGEPFEDLRLFELHVFFTEGQANTSLSLARSSRAYSVGCRCCMRGRRSCSRSLGESQRV